MTEPVPTPTTRRSRWGAIAGVVTIGVGIVGIGYAIGWLGVEHDSPPATKPVVVKARIEQPVEPVADPLRSANFIFWATPVPTPDLAFVDGSGKAHKFSDFRGRAVVLNLWAIWCVPCRWELPSLDRLQAQFDQAKLLVLPLSGDGASDVGRFYGENGVTSLGVYTATTGGAIIKLGFAGFPGTVLIDANGNEIGRKIGPLEWDDETVVDTLRQHFGVPISTIAKGAP